MCSVKGFSNLFEFRSEVHFSLWKFSEASFFLLFVGQITFLCFTTTRLEQVSELLFYKFYCQIVYGLWYGNIETDLNSGIFCMSQK